MATSSNQVMPFSFSNTPATFQGYVNKILAEKLDVFVIVYLDDILIYNEDLGQSHVKAVQWVFENLRKYSLFANLKKCQFHHVESAQGVWMEDESQVLAWAKVSTRHSSVHWIRQLLLAFHPGVQ